MDITKITTMFLIIIVALASIGIAYSLWMQELTITGSISTGEVLVGIHNNRTLDSGPNFQMLGGNLYPQDSPNDGTSDPNKTPEGDNSEGKNVASHNSNNDGASVFIKEINGVSYNFYHSVIETVSNVYPWYKSGTELWIGNGGTIPIKIADLKFEEINGNSQLLDFLVFDIWNIKLWDGSKWNDIDNGLGYESLMNKLLCYQLEPCQTLSVYIEFYFLEEINDPAIKLPYNSDITFEIKVTVAQWNEVDCNGNGPPPFCTPDLSITKEVDNNIPTTGSQITYSITVTNNALCDATGVIVEDELPEELTYNSHNANPLDYDPIDGIWDIGILEAGETATLTITATVEDIGSSINYTQLGLLIDGSNSINTSEWNLLKNGLANAIENNSIFPHNDRVELTVIQIGGTIARVEIYPIIISDSTVASTVASQIRSISKLGGTTPLAAGLTKTVDILKASVNFLTYPKKVINIVTDGQPTYPSPQSNAEAAAIDARDYLLDELGMTTADDGEIDVEAIGDDADTEWLKGNITWPGAYDWPPSGPGWVRYVEDFNGFEDAIKEKFQIILSGIKNCAILYSDQTSPIEACVTINPQQ